MWVIPAQRGVFLEFLVQDLLDHNSKGKKKRKENKQLSVKNLNSRQNSLL